MKQTVKLAKARLARFQSDSIMTIGDSKTLKGLAVRAGVVKVGK